MCTGGVVLVLFMFMRFQLSFSSVLLLHDIHTRMKFDCAPLPRVSQSAFVLCYPDFFSICASSLVPLRLLSVLLSLRNCSIVSPLYHLQYFFLFLIDAQWVFHFSLFVCVAYLYQHASLSLVPTCLPIFVCIIPLHTHSFSPPLLPHASLSSSSPPISCILCSCNLYKLDHWMQQERCLIINADGAVLYFYHGSLITSHQHTALFWAYVCCFAGAIAPLFFLFV